MHEWTSNQDHDKSIEIGGSTLLLKLLTPLKLVHVICFGFSSIIHKLKTKLFSLITIQVGWMVIKFYKYC